MTRVKNVKNSNYIGSEFKKMMGKRSIIISVAIVLLVPLVYAMIMLSPKWGPQDNIDNIPVAVVNNDAGAEQDGETVHIGNELIANLEGNPTLGWEDRKSTRLNSSHVAISYAVF